MSVVTPPADAPSVDGSRAQKSRRYRMTFPKRGDLPALGRVRSSKNARRVAVVLMVALVGALITAAFAPWLQSVSASGSVINFDPTVRPQVLDAPISGRVVRLGEGIREMAFVKQGQIVAEMADLDPDRLARLQNQLENLSQAVRSSRDALSAAERERTLAREGVVFFQTNVETLRALKRETVASATAQVEIAEQNLLGAKQKLDEAKAVLFAAEENYKRQKSLYEDDEIASERVFQAAEATYKQAKVSLEQARIGIAAAEKALEAKKKDRDSRVESAESAIQLASASLQQASGRVEAANASVAKYEKDLQQAINAETALSSDVRRQENQVVLAPIDGYLVAIYADGGASVLSKGSPVAKIVPKSEDRVVQVWLDGNDAPLVEPGRHVRLQFEGWPALQFTGWPSVAVGTFGGEVLSVDAVDNGTGKFRALIGEVTGKSEVTGLVDEPWPHGRFLRPGVLTKSWILLDTVPLWWEIWRNLNGFPPTVDIEHEDKPTKVPKLPKP